MTPKHEALAFRIWQYCEAIGWNCTSIEVADELNEHHVQVVCVINKKGWANRLRSALKRSHGNLEKNSGILTGESLAASREVREMFNRDGVIV